MKSGLSPSSALHPLSRFRVYSNGREVPELQRIEILRDETCGVFESMRAYGGKISHEQEHLKRLRESAKTVGYGPLPKPGTLHQEIVDALRASGEKDVSVRVTLHAGKAFVIVGARGTSREFYGTGVTLKTACSPRGGAHAFPYQTKAAAYQQAILASGEPNPGKAFDWLFLTREGQLTETRAGNFFLVRYLRPGKPSASKCALLTPPEHLILNGVVRRFVIKCARESGFRVMEGPLTRHDFFNADEAFLSNTSWEVLPVRELDGRTIGLQIPGPMTLKLHRSLKRRI